MNKAKFWRLIEEAKGEADGDLEEHVQILAQKLEELAPGDIARFQRILDETMALAYRWDLRAAAHIINSGCSDEGFEAFRGWLIAQGEEIFQEAVDNPESLVAVAEAHAACEEILMAPDEAYVAKTGAELEMADKSEAEPVGEEWTEEELPTMYPKLWEAFGDSEEEEA